MEGFRQFWAAAARRSLILTVAGAAVLLAFKEWIPAIAVVAGCLIGLAYLFHIASGFNRLVKGGKYYLPLLTVESLLRVLLAGAAPFFIVGRHGWLGYFTYLAGFVAPLAVAIFLYKNRIDAESAQTDHAKTPAQTSA
jgi:hypothetical protein